MTAKFDAAAIPSQAGKTILVTGATAGLGASSVAALASASPAHIILSGRNQSAADAKIAELKAKYANVNFSFVRMDLTSLQSVQEGARHILDEHDRLDTVMLNAGIMATPPAKSQDGFEIQWAANVLGHALLVKQLMPLLERSAAATQDVRVLSLSSTAENMTAASFTPIAFDGLRTEQTGIGFPFPGAAWARYAQSKLGNLLYAKELAKHHPSITSVSVHPGIIRTGLFAGLAPSARFVGAMVTTLGKVTPLEQGWWNQVWAATCPVDELKNGAYYEPVGKLSQGSKNARNEELAKKTWTWIEEALKDYN